MTEQPPGTLSRDSPKASAVTRSSSSANFECSEASPTWRMLIATGSKEEPAFSDSIELVTRFELVFIVKGYLHSIWDHFFIYCLRTEVCYFFPVTPPSTSWTATPQCWLSKLKLINASNVAIFTFSVETFLLSLVLTKTHQLTRMKLSLGLTTVQCAHPCKFQAPWAWDPGVIPILKYLTEHGFLFI